MYISFLVQFHTPSKTVALFQVHSVLKVMGEIVLLLLSPLLTVSPASISP